jgi:isopenicillin N synthase-like dioxygenase
MREAGFVLLVGEPVPPEVPHELRAAATDFFRLPTGVKEAYRAERLGTRGWVPYGAEANAYASGEESPPDMKESFVCPTSDLPGHEAALTALWPDEVPHLRDAANAHSPPWRRSTWSCWSWPRWPWASTTGATWSTGPGWRAP